MPVALDLQILVIVVGFVILGILIRHWTKGSSSGPDHLITELIKSFDLRSHEQAKEIREQTRVLNERLDNAARVIAHVQRSIGEFSEIGRSMRDLEAFLKNPKLRGNLGEEVLADLLGQIFPKGSFHLQYTFKSGARVDAAIKTLNGILPIDAKFPMESYELMIKGETEAVRESAKKEFVRAVKNHIDDISGKYILPDEGTLDFALMYVPSESVFYELCQLNNIMVYAKRRRIYPVSPTTLYAHLQTILLSFAGKQLETKTRHVFKLLRAMAGDYEKIETNLGILGKHLTNAYNQMGNVTQSFTLLGQKLTSTQMIETQPEQERLPDEVVV
ncbi:DNA recombination protein RmuC [Candidatus Gottesmanbacteria bacterium]|nr:DNA recombination protein RmuC [Candidatus Gottesmanbacteria bacterium]